ncbi:hypothetical protein GE061_006521 [Apolygus lucorum]|uniref:Uncharacterized protein n=1 Tax=Apolygus lucorum TaxID=248454 RepID=A0A8S9WVT8_APOLU|nr:hypothetical protein GE061_006521 [Apolygus lucorum]
MEFVENEQVGSLEQLTEDLPEIDPQKVSLQIPSEIVAAGFNVVNRGAPVFGEVIQRTAERLVNVGASLKPLFASSFGFGGAGANLKRETGDESGSQFEQENEASSDILVTEEAPSQFKRSYDPSQNRSASQNELVPEPTEEEKEKIRNILLARKVIQKLLEQQVEKELEAQNAMIEKETEKEELSEKSEDAQDLAVVTDDVVTESSTDVILSSEDSSTLASEVEPSVPSSANSEQISVIEDDARQDTQSSQAVTQSDSIQSQRSPDTFQVYPSESTNSPSVIQSNAVLQNRQFTIPNSQSFPNRQSPIDGVSPLQTNPSAFQTIRSAFQNSGSNLQSNPSIFQNTAPTLQQASSPPFKNFPSTFQNTAPTLQQASPSANPSPSPANPYFHQQYRDYNPHVKRQAPQFDYYPYQSYQNVPRYRQQSGNYFTQNRYQSYGY